MSSDDSGFLRKNGHITVREMEIDDLAPVYHLGERLFTSTTAPLLYRTWDTFEVTQCYNSDPEYCLVAEDAQENVIGFALGTTIEKERSAWKYGYLTWLAVAPEYQGKKVATRLLKEFEKRMKEEGVRIIMVDTEANNHRAIKFFQRHGFAQPKEQIWLKKSLARSHHATARPLPVGQARRQQKSAAKRPARPPKNPVPLTEDISAALEQGQPVPINQQTDGRAEAHPWD